MTPDLRLSTSQVSESQRAMFNLLKATLEYPVDSTTKTEKLLDDMLFIYTMSEDTPYPACQLWSMVIALAERPPAGHEWQTSLIESLHLLRQLDDSVAQDDDGYDPLHRRLVEQILMTPSVDPVTREGNNRLEPDDLDLLERWKAVNSFLARASSRGDFMDILDAGINQVVTALEVPPAAQKPVAACYVWVATEWINHCGSLIFDMFQGGSKMCDRLECTGSLCESEKIPPRSIQRWEFWKERLSKFDGNIALLYRIQMVINAMNDIQKGEHREA